MGASSINTTMKLLNTLLVLTLFFTTIISIPLQKASLEEECDDEAVSDDYEPALGLPDLVIDLRENVAAPVETEEDSEDDIVTEEPEVLEMATEECEEEPITEEPETEAAPLVTEECEEGITTQEPETAAPSELNATSECADEEVIEELPVIFEAALPDEDLIVEEECEEE